MPGVCAATLRKLLLVTDDGQRLLCAQVLQYNVGGRGIDGMQLGNVSSKQWQRGIQPRCSAPCLYTSKCVLGASPFVAVHLKGSAL